MGNIFLACITHQHLHTKRCCIVITLSW
jgi:hypothetical protein